ncbi:hypothetical protein ADL22_29580 [Streptomyces sp. NRRL F-4489]|nr:hypothetical protein ADL22_29580 [Streptomyces sp. NRRL F-4489]
MTLLGDTEAGPEHEEPSGALPRWRLSFDRRGLEFTAGRHLHLMASSALLAWLASFGAGATGAHWLRWLA